MTLVGSSCTVNSCNFGTNYIYEGNCASTEHKSLKKTLNSLQSHDFPDTMRISVPPVTLSFLLLTHSITFIVFLDMSMRPRSIASKGYIMKCKSPFLSCSPATQRHEQFLSRTCNMHTHARVRARAHTRAPLPPWNYIPIALI